MVSPLLITPLFKHNSNKPRVIKGNLGGVDWGSGSGLYWGYMGVIWGLYGGYMGIMEKKMETTVLVGGD